MSDTSGSTSPPPRASYAALIVSSATTSSVVRGRRGRCEDRPLRVVQVSLTHTCLGAGIPFVRIAPVQRVRTVGHLSAVVVAVVVAVGVVRRGAVDVDLVAV